MKRPVVLVVEAEESLRQGISTLLVRYGCDVIERRGLVDLRRLPQRGGTNLVIVGLSGGSGSSGLETARQIRRTDKLVPIILMTAESSEDLAIAALRAGANDYLRHPVSFDDLVVSVDRCLSECHARRVEARASDLTNDECMIGESPPVRAVKEYIRRVSSTNSSVLITGETGTGKELVAELIHRESPRCARPFVSINCAAIPENLLESELFGYERGAFTGAHSLKEGKLKLAEGGTVFFDEIGDMSPYAQAKILRAIENKEIHRLGGHSGVPLNVRVVAATNQDLERLVGEGKFREDLYFRINVARIHLPPLREKKEDIPRLIDHYIRQLNFQFGREVEGFTDEALDYLLRYAWPGNVRELKNLLEAIFVNLPPQRISLIDLPDQFRKRLQETDALPQDERCRLLSALLSTNWNKSRAAQKLHWSRMTLYRKMAKYYIIGMSKTDKATTSGSDTKL